uniref:Uncharacterized protein n=1 Tax=Anguilla anguilla TaxID=7936 RepID=A0A0E9PRX2_ANGAN
MWTMRVITANHFRDVKALVDVRECISCLLTQKWKHCFIS